MKEAFKKRARILKDTHHSLMIKKNEMLVESNGVYNRYKNRCLQPAILLWRGDTILTQPPIPC
jgi:hypothetical protein